MPSFSFSGVFMTYLSKYMQVIWVILLSHAIKPVGDCNRHEIGNQLRVGRVKKLYFTADM